MSKHRLWVHQFNHPLDYNRTESLQYHLHRLRLAEKIPDTLLLLEHSPTISMGKRGQAHEVLIPHEQLVKKGYTVATSDRGGQVTYHGPGQLVGYCIFNLYHAQRRLREFIAQIEQSLVSTLAVFGIVAHSHDEHRGVWVREKKIASVGIAINQGVTRHGFALNVVNDLSSFNDIIACGLNDVRMTRVLDESPKAGLPETGFPEADLPEAHNGYPPDGHASVNVSRCATECAKALANILDCYIEYPKDFPKPEWWNR